MGWGEICSVTNFSYKVGVSDIPVLPTSPLVHPLCQPWTNITVSMLIWGILNLFSSPATFNFVQFPAQIHSWLHYVGTRLRRWRNEGHGLCQLKLHSELKEHKFFSITLVVRQKNIYICSWQCCIWLESSFLPWNMKHKVDTVCATLNPLQDHFPLCSGWVRDLSEGRGNVLFQVHQNAQEQGSRLYSNRIWCFCTPAYFDFET